MDTLFLKQTEFLIKDSGQWIALKTESNKYWHCLKSVKDGWNQTQNCKLFQYKLYLVLSMHVSYIKASSNRLFLQVSLKHNRML